jgi:1-acyl-sn-glycerol-3-phosphate acyltransferase
MDVELAPPPTAPPARAEASRHPAQPVRVPSPPDTLPLPELRAALRARLPGIGLPADLALAPIDHLFDHAGSSLRFSPAPACYYANHQTSYESFLIAFLHLAVTGVPLLAVTHPGLFDNDYGEHCMLLAEQLRRLNHPAADAIQVVAVPHELKPARDFLLGLPEHLQGRSLLVHVGAWRELYEGQPVNTMAKDLMEVTLRLGRPIVPIRISGGLPARSLGYKFHLPYRMGRLTIAMAPPIEPAAFLGIDPLGQRRMVLAAINAMAPPAGAYAGRANTALLKRCLRRHVQTGSSALKCFLLEAVETMADPSRETEKLREFIRYGVLPGEGVADADWFARQAMWISDGRGLKTV